MAASLQPPDTPIMLYIGAGFDLSPLLTFAPGGPPYPIVPPAPSPYTYTSFIFVDAKPRHTFAYMVPDFNEWKTEKGRVRNVLHYAQGMLDRWRAIPGAPDLILFEGGGTPEQRQARLHDPAWHWATSLKRSVLHSRHRRLAPRQEQERSRPLTTLYYLFNTLDVEMMQAPRMARLWESVEALYVHGLKIHPRTGAGLRSLGTTLEEEKPLPLSTSLKHCFVLVGSWSGKGGVRDVDFVLQARERERLRQVNPLWSRYPHYHASSSSSTASSPSSSVSSLSLAPITFYRPRTRGTPYHDSEEDASSEWDTPLSSLDDLPHSALGLDPFHIPIPQIAYSPKLWRGAKRGRYFVMRSVSECMQVVRERADVGE